LSVLLVAERVGAKHQLPVELLAAQRRSAVCTVKYAVIYSCRIELLTDFSYCGALDVPDAVQHLSQIVAHSIFKERALFAQNACQLLFEIKLFEGWRHILWVDADLHCKWVDFNEQNAL
jgi:hypothetical protein